MTTERPAEPRAGARLRALRGISAKAMALVLCLSASLGAAADDVPFVTTPDTVTLAMLELAAVTPRDHVVDLGSGDGRIVITAARRFGASGLGVEIVPDLVRTSRERARAAGVADRVEFREQDLFATDLGAATVVTMYLLPDVNLQLRPRLLALAPGTRIVSHDWDLGDWAPDRTVTVDVPEKALGRDKFSRVHLWIVPAPCTAAGAPTARASRSCSASSASRRRSRAPAPPRRPRCSTAASRRRRCAAKASTLSPCRSTARPSASPAARAARRRAPSCAHGARACP